MCSNHPEANIHRPEEPSQFLFPDKIVQGNETGDTLNKVQGCDGVVGNTEVIYPAPEGENKI